MSRVLVVVDGAGSGALAAEYLRLAGFEVVEAADATGALDALASAAPPALLVADDRLPDMSGPELCARVRAKAPGTKVVLLSATGEAPPRDAVPDAWISKPFRPKDLLAEVRRLLA